MMDGRVFCRKPRRDVASGIPVGVLGESECVFICIEGCYWNDNMLSTHKDLFISVSLSHLSLLALLCVE